MRLRLVTEPASIPPDGVLQEWSVEMKGSAATPGVPFFATGFEPATSGLPVLCQIELREWSPPSFSYCNRTKARRASPTPCYILTAARRGLLFYAAPQRRPCLQIPWNREAAANPHAIWA